MVFVPPTWYEGMLTMIGYQFGIPLLVIIGVSLISYWLFKKYGDDSEIRENARFFGIFCGLIIGALVFIGMMFVGTELLWHYNYEVPSVSEKVVTIQGIQPHPNVRLNEWGNPVISNAGQLMFVTTEGEGFSNTETWWLDSFQKFETRDIFQQLKVNGTYKIKYYGWREGKTSTFPNILSVEEVIDENGTSPNVYEDYFGSKMPIATTSSGSQSPDTSANMLLLNQPS